MAETSRLEKFTNTKYLLLIISFGLLMDIFLIMKGNGNILTLNLKEIQKEMNLGTFIVFLGLFSFYNITFKGITFMCIGFLERSVKKRSLKFTIEYNKLLSFSFKHQNKVIYDYAIMKLNEQKKTFETISVYLGAICLFMIDFFACKGSMVDLFILKILSLGEYHISFIGASLALLILLVIFFFLTVIPFIIIMDFTAEKDIIKINQKIKNEITNYKVHRQK